MRKRSIQIEDIGPCPFCGCTPDTETSYECGYITTARLRCQCGIFTKWVPVSEFNPERFQLTGPENPYSGAYYAVDWRGALKALWQRRAGA